METTQLLVNGLNVFWGGDGNDIITGGDSAENRLHGQAGNDTLTGGDGFDFIRGIEGENIINGGAGGDFIIAGLGDENFDGGAGDDTIRFTGDYSSYRINENTVDILTVRDLRTEFRQGDNDTQNVETFEFADERGPLQSRRLPSWWCARSLSPTFLEMKRLPSSAMLKLKQRSK